MAYTPGPYIIAEPGGPAGPFYGIVNDKGTVVAMQILRRDDAVLWMAAPDLLAECKAALWRMEQYNYSAMHPTMNRLSAAIAKAEPPAEARG